MKNYLLLVFILIPALSIAQAQDKSHHVGSTDSSAVDNNVMGNAAENVERVAPVSLKLLDSPNVRVLVDNLPFAADYPIAREIRYTYGSVLELTKKKFDPYFITNEDKDYFDVSKKGISGQVLDQQYEAFQNQGNDWIDKNKGSWSVGQLEDYTAFQNSMENSMLTMHTYFEIMGALSSLGNKLIKKEAESLKDWASYTTKCTGPKAPEGSLLHLNIMRYSKAQRFKLHSSHDLIVVITLEKGDGTTLSSTVAMQFWRNSKKEIVAPERAVPAFETKSTEKKLKVLPIAQNNYTNRFALLINTGIKDLYSKLEEPDVQ